MDLRAFWNIIGDARSGARDDKDFLRRIDARLRMLKPEELMEFESHFEKIHTESYSWNLWGAAYLMNGGCGDDGFEYFRAWLIAQGKQTFEMVVKDPDALATVADRGRRASRGFEEFMHLARETYSMKRKLVKRCRTRMLFFKEWSYLSQVNVGISMRPPR